MVGEKLGGALGSMVAILGVCLPSAVYMYVVGIYYHIHGDHVWVTASLKGVAAAAVGLILFTVVGLCQKSVGQRTDLVFVALTVIAVNGFHQSVPKTLIAVGILAIAFHRPRVTKKASVVQ
jgi:chromate transporter